MKWTAGGNPPAVWRPGAPAKKMKPVRTLSWIACILIAAGCRSGHPAQSGHGLPQHKTGHRPATASSPAPPPAVSRQNRAEANAHYAAGVIHEMRQNEGKAQEEFYQAAMADPTRDGLVLEAVRHCLQSKDYAKAMALLDRAGANPNSTGYVFALKGLVYAQMGETNKAIEANNIAIRKLPRSISGYQNLVSLQLQQKDYRAAWKTLEAASRVTGVDPPFMIELAELLIQYGRQTRKLDELKGRITGLLGRARDKLEANPIQLLKLADDYDAVGEPGEAAAFYEELLERFPDLPALREKLVFLFSRSKQYDKAEEQLRLLLVDNPGSPQIYLQLGGLALEQKKFGEAEENYRKAIRLNPRFEPAYFDLALSQINQKKMDLAFKTIDDAERSFGRKFTTEYFRAIAFSRQKKYSEAVRHYTEAEVMARASEPERLNHLFYFDAAAAYERHGDVKQAEKFLEKCLELQPDFAEAMNYLGYMWAENNQNLDQARDLIQKAVKLEPRNAAFLDSLGWVYFKLKQPVKALGFLEEALKNLEEPDATIYDHLGDVYRALRKIPQAREAWKKSVSLEESDAVSRKLKEVDRDDGR